MVNINNEDETKKDIETIDDDTDTTEMELEDAEEITGDKLKSLRSKLKEAETKARDLHEELQRNKADFLNARKRLEEERLRDRERAAVMHVEKLLPLCDSFFLAMQDKNAIESSDPKWRRGIEGTYAQLRGIMDSYGITAFDPTGEEFDPTRHEALTMIPVSDESNHNRIISVIQQGYTQKRGDVIELIRPARVTVGELG